MTGEGGDLEASRGLRDGEDVFYRPAQDAHDFGCRDASLATWSGVEVNPATGQPTADGPGVDPQKFCYLANSDIVRHALILGTLRALN